jgi:CCR4-NOT transcriptional regulation complex NOT5 subunit
MINSSFSATPTPDPNQKSNLYNPAPQKPSLEAVVVQIGDAVLASTDTVNCVAERMDELVQQVQQQGYQIFALTEELQNLTTLHTTTLDRLDAIATRLENAGLAS